MKLEELGEEQFYCRLARFFDGEGSLTIARRKKEKYQCYGIRMDLVNANLPVLQAIQQRIGGDIQKHTSGYGRQIYHLRFSPNVVKVVLPKMMPFLQLKRQQADVVMNFPNQRFIQGRGRGNAGRIPDLETKAIQEQLCQEIQSLNHRVATLETTLS